MSNCLVLGGAGFVGRHLIKRLLERGDSVVAVDSCVYRTGAIHPSVGWPFFDIKWDQIGGPSSVTMRARECNLVFRRMDCREYFDHNRSASFDYVFHLAAIVGGRILIENNPILVAEDLSIDAAMWRWAVDSLPKKVVYFSSSAAYPVAYQSSSNSYPLIEDIVWMGKLVGIPDMTYGWAKLTGEYLARVAYEKHGIKSCVFRPFSGYGEDQDMNYPFPSIIHKAIAGRKTGKIEVWGSGKQVRDFIHIEDCITGILKIVDQIDDASPVNLSTGIGTDFLAMASMAGELAGYKPEVVTEMSAPTGVQYRVGDTTKQMRLGFRPEIKLADGIKRAIEYFTKESKCSTVESL